MNKIKLICYFTLMMLFINNCFSQSIFKTSFEGCNTDYFNIESDSIVAVTKNDIIKVLANNLDEQVISGIKGILSLQILIDDEGKSCLLSVDNETNIKNERLNLKNIINSKLEWYKPKEKISALIIIKFYGNEVELKRLGISPEKGLHVIY
ncbi:hypothetical protein ACW5R3_03885 [Bizionia sp. KMM 8389]